MTYIVLIAILLFGTPERPDPRIGIVAFETVEECHAALANVRDNPRIVEPGCYELRELPEAAQ